MPIDHFKGFQAADFERWLRVGFESYLLEGAGAWAFPGADAAIRRADFLSLGLKDAYGALDASLRASFRDGLANLLASLEPDPRHVEIFEHLLSLAAALPAPEILRVLPARVGNGFFGSVVNGEGDSLFGVAMMTVARLAAPRQDAVAALRALIYSGRHFHEAYAGMALEALCRADDENLVAHLTQLRELLREMFRAAAEPDRVQRDLAESIFDAVGLERVVDAWPRLKYFDRDRPDAGLDGWLVRSLLAGSDSLLVCEQRADDHLYVYVGTRPAVSIRLPEEGKGFFGLMSLLRREALITPPGGGAPLPPPGPDEAALMHRFGLG